MNYLKKFLPLIFCELYLLFTIILFFYGPIEYNIHNRELFFFYLFLYHSLTILGYILGVNIKIYRKNYTTNIVRIIMGYPFLTFLALLSSLLSNANLTMSNSLFPSNLIDLLKNGFNVESIGQAYFEKIQLIDSFQGNKLQNIFFFFIAWPKVIYIPYIIYNWEKFNFNRKVLSLIIISIPVLSGISTGTNKPIFDFVLLFFFSLSIFFVSNQIKYNNFFFLKRKFFLIISILAIFFFLYFFNTAMKSRNVDLDFIEITSSLGDIKVKNNVVENSKENNVNIWLANYLVQGYYGFSLALDQNFTTTFGFGNSPFLSRQFEWITGISLKNRTYQYKIDNLWSESVQWHTFYSQFANDFHFLGVSVLLFFIGFFMAITWKSIFLFSNYFALLLMPLYFEMFIFIPANNQIFGYIETLSTFFILNYLMFKSIKFSK